MNQLKLTIYRVLGVISGALCAFLLTGNVGVAIIGAIIGAIIIPYADPFPGAGQPYDEDVPVELAGTRGLERGGGGGQ
ncbi:hypothetical protein QUF63_13435 [Anaerolineales bacterium HSG25]|nr:hypothetical protein [Anaerolineales bacterium HSG25]